MDPCRVAVIGATGAVGQVFLRLMEERRFPTDGLRLCASTRSVGKTLTVNDREIEVEEATPDLLSQVDIAFISASGEVSRELAPVAVENGALVIDDSSAFRMHSAVPLVVPEVNADDLEGHRGIISIPNCSTTPLVMVLNPLAEINPVQRVIVDTYQSVSGAGAGAIRELETQSQRVLNGHAAEPSVFPHQVAFNALPHIEPFTASGYTKEEMKMMEETRKVLHTPELRVSATCVRIPVMVSHSEAVHMDFSRPMDPSDVRDILSGAAGVEVMDEPGSNVYPTPTDTEGKDEVFVGRIRKDASSPNGIALWIVSDNLRKGAALNALQIAEEVLRRELLLTTGGMAGSW